MDNIKRNFSLFLLFVFTSAIYLHNLSNDVYGGDVGDLVSAIIVKGIAHPPGYPLFTMLGIFFSSLPLPFSPIWKIGLISAVSASIAVALCYLLVLKLTRSKLASLISALFLAFFYPFWLYAELAEVFALNSLFVFLLLYLGISYFQTRKVKYLYLLSFFTALSLTHHLIIVLLFPSVFILAFVKNSLLLKQIRILGICFLLFLLGLLPLLYLPIAAMFDPPINWGNLKTLDGFIRLILRLDYGWHGSQDIDVPIRLLVLKTYAHYLLTSLTPPGVFLILLGLFYGIKKYTLITLSLLSSFILTGPFFILYSSTLIFGIFQYGMIERFYMISGTIATIFLGVGALVIASFIMGVLVRVVPMYKKKLYYKHLFVAIFAIIPGILFINNFPKTDLHMVNVGNNLAVDMLTPLKKNSLVFLGGDTALFNTWYGYYGLNIRNDVMIINLYQLDKTKLFTDTRNKLHKQPKFKKIDLNTSVIAVLSKKYPIYAFAPLDMRNSLNKDLVWRPYGLVYELIDIKKDILDKKTYLKQQKNIWDKFHYKTSRSLLTKAERNPTLLEISTIYAQGYSNIATHLLGYYKDAENAAKYYRTALQYDPDIKDAHYGIGLISLDNKQCVRAYDSFSTIIQKDPGDRRAYAFLYATYAFCAKDQKRAKSLEKDYTKKFKSSLTAELKKELGTVTTK